jgi:hypothetical protein
MSLQQAKEVANSIEFKVSLAVLFILEDKYLISSGFQIIKQVRVPTTR